MRAGKRGATLASAKAPEVHPRATSREGLTRGREAGATSESQAKIDQEKDRVECEAALLLSRGNRDARAEARSRNSERTQGAKTRAKSKGRPTATSVHQTHENFGRTRELH